MEISPCLESFSLVETVTDVQTSLKKHGGMEECIYITHVPENKSMAVYEKLLISGLPCHLWGYFTLVPLTAQLLLVSLLSPLDPQNFASLC